MLPRSLHSAYRSFEYRFPRHSQFMLKVNIRSGDEGMYPSRLGGLDGLGGPVDIVEFSSGKAGDRGPFNLRRNHSDGFKVTDRRDRKSGFYNINAKFDELACDLELFFHIHRCTRGLFAVPKGSVEYPDDSHFLTSPSALVASGLADEAAAACCPSRFIRLLLKNRKTFSTRPQTKYAIANMKIAVEGRIRRVNSTMTKIIRAQKGFLSLKSISFTP